MTQTTKCPVCADLASSGMEVTACHHKDAEIIHFKKNAKWAVYEIKAVVPLEDQYEHERFNPDCPCLPKWDENILVHQAFDGRTQYE